MSDRGVLAVVKDVWRSRCVWVLPIAVLAPLKLLFMEDPKYDQAYKCLYVIVLMAILWLTEAIPIPATALVPIFIFPMIGVASAKEVSGSYLSDTSMLFLGGLIVAVAVEEWNLHKRIALMVMRLLGVQPAMLMLGLMLPTWFLSMWISNTAATAMMVPIIQAVVKTFCDVRMGVDTYAADNQAIDLSDEMSNTDPPREVNGRSYTISKGGDMSNGKPHQPEEDSPKTAETETIPMEELPRQDSKAPRDIQPGDEIPSEFVLMGKAWSLCVAYAANIGGIATLTGTPPNLVMKELTDQLYKEAGAEGQSPITFGQWMGFAFPLSLLVLVLAWLLLCVLFLRSLAYKRLDKKTSAAVTATIRRQWIELGRITLAETLVGVVFILLIIFWLFRAPANINGWGTLFENSKGISLVSDSTPVMLLCVSMFILPAKVPKLFCCKRADEVPSYTPLLTWKAVEQKVPWGVIVLLGGGFAIANMSKISGLSDMLGEMLQAFSDYEPWVLNLIISLVSAAATEVTSNTATTTLLLPIMSALSLSIGSNPLYLMISTTVACSFAFMLPVATPPNAIVFATGWLSIPNMFLTGLPMNLLAVGSLALAVNTWGNPLFGLNTFPEIFGNSTATA